MKVIRIHSHGNSDVLKVDNLDRPSKAIVYPFALILLFGFGYLNYRRVRV